MKHNNNAEQFTYEPGRTVERRVRSMGPVARRSVLSADLFRSTACIGAAAAEWKFAVFAGNNFHRIAELFICQSPGTSPTLTEQAGRPWDS